MYKIFISAMAYDSGKSGIADYINNVTKELAMENDVEIALLKSDIEKFPVKSLKIMAVSDFLGKPLINMLWHIFILPFIIRKKKYDFIFLPAANRRVLAFYPYKTISTVHDLSQFNIEAKYDLMRMIYIKKVLPFFLKRSDAFIAVSLSTKNDMIRFLKISENRITVLYNGFRSRFLDENNIMPSKFGKKYILYVARVEHPGKNHMNLIKAYESLNESHKAAYDLVLAGPLKERSEEVVDHVNSSKDRDRIHFTGFIDDIELPSLYRNASMFVFPSFYEGFGIPLLEAMACNVPVASSNRSSLPEVGGNAAIYFDPDDVGSIENAIEKLITDEKMVLSLIENGKKQICNFSWKKHSDGIIGIFEGLNEKH